MSTAQTKTTTTLKLSEFHKKNIFSQDELERHSGDVVVTCGKEEFRANRLLLCLFSKLFRGVFGADKDADSVFIPTLKPSAVLAALELVHKGSVDVEAGGDLEKEVMEAAVVLGVEGLDGGEGSATAITASGIVEALAIVDQIRTAKNKADDGSSEADTVSVGASSPTEGDKSEKVFGSIFGKITAAAATSDEEEMDITPSCSEKEDAAAVELRKADSAAERLFREISGTLPIQPGDLLQLEKEAAKVAPVEKEDDCSKSNILLRVSYDKSMPAHSADAATPSTPFGGSSSKQKRPRGSPKQSGGRYYRLRLNKEANASRIGGKTWRCSSPGCGYWSYSRRDLARHGRRSPACAEK